MLPPRRHDAPARIYVETTIHAPVERVWALSQDPQEHARWDLRFGSIVAEAPGRFRYSTFGVHGLGAHAGTRERADGGATSSLRFTSPHRLSPIAEGAGYWRYVPTDGGRVRFLTGYDYEPRYRRLDRLVRPLMGWATAWSFDRLRLWAEIGQTPRRSVSLALVDVAARTLPFLLVLRRPWLLPVATLLALRPTPSRVPSARRCLRTPPDRTSATAPGQLTRIDVPR
ncbi:hypothetical protein BHE97_12030 [Aeromicrobium sp. PE09-221]|nr:hypothetical protein BHE97_12030 [Aeromicrobium sp. PE09-221]